ncbi:MAG TPA: DUF1501 domain-containing protein [Gemmatales bacterium]|nr:DUF1501 domain-containing protein [Gemmatales bacterium]
MSAASEGGQTMLGMNRRHFMRHVAGFSLMAGPSAHFLAKLAAAAPAMRREHKSLIILWMNGGPSQLDTWDMKPGAPTAGQFKPMNTAADGIQICEHMPNIAKQMKHLSIIRSLVTNEGSHERGRVLMHTAYPDNPAVQFPSMGSIVSQQLTPKDMALPGFISVTQPPVGPGFLGMAYAPFTVQTPGRMPNNINPPGDVNNPKVAMSLRARSEMLRYIENNFVNQQRGEAAKAHREMYDKAFALTYSKLKSVFDLERDSNGRPMNASLRDEYGRHDFGNGCLLARKLVEEGVPCVEVALGSWDNHQGIFSALHNTTGNRGGGLVDRLDQGMGALVRDLVDRGLWKNTVVLWLGEFGRTPRVNPAGGRDHWARCWSVAVGGGAIKGGIAYGSTDKDGTSIKDNPVSVGDLFATVYEALGISPDLEIRDPLGRPRKISGENGGTPVADLLG